MAKHRWILEVVAALLVIVFACSLGMLFLQTIQQENTCWAAGYETPITYRGECYCFGKDGRPEVMALARLEGGDRD